MRELATARIEEQYGRQWLRFGQHWYDAPIAQTRFDLKAWDLCKP